MSRLKAFNLVFQFTGFRLAKMLDGGRQAWAILGPVVPCTGWRGPYRGWPKSARLTRWK